MKTTISLVLNAYDSKIRIAGQGQDIETGAVRIKTPTVFLLDVPIYHMGFSINIHAYYHQPKRKMKL
ncbi:hypothetical protein [Desulfocicer niacini]